MGPVSVKLYCIRNESILKGGQRTVPEHILISTNFGGIQLMQFFWNCNNSVSTILDIFGYPLKNLEINLGELFEV
jgi:hypothetical protein